MTYNGLSGFRKWLNPPSLAVPTLSPRAKDRLLLVGAGLGFFVFVGLASDVVDVIKSSGLAWLAVGLAAAAGILSSAFTVPVLLLLILIALWNRNSSVASLRAEVEELTEHLEELEQRIERIVPTVRDNDSDV